MTITTTSPSELINWLMRNGVNLDDCDWLLTNAGEWLPVRFGRVRVTRDGGRYTAEIESEV